MTYETMGLSLLWGLAIGGFSLYCLRVGSEMTYVRLADGRMQIRRVPMLMRLVLPLAPNLTRLTTAPALKRVRHRTAGKLISAGYEGIVATADFLALKVLMPLTYGVVWCLIVRALATAAPGTTIASSQPGLYAMGILYLYVFPDIWLARELKARHKKIQRALPFVLDLLTLSVEAGLDFMTALQRNLSRGKIDALAEELIRLIREIQLGKTRREALIAMSERVNLPDLRSVVNALVQADELGVSIGSILRIQADQIRQRRFQRAEKLANEAPVKMLFPLMVFIFPAVFLILLGPLMARLLQEGF